MFIKLDADAHAAHFDLVMWMYTHVGVTVKEGSRLLRSSRRKTRAHLDWLVAHEYAVAPSERTGVYTLTPAWRDRLDALADSPT